MSKWLSVLAGFVAAFAAVTPVHSQAWSLAYVDPSTNNVYPLQSGSTISFPNTLVNGASSVAVLVINNSGANGLINSIGLGGNSSSVFQIVNQPFLPATVPPSQEASFGVRFSPTQQQTFSATLSLNLSGQSVTVYLTAQGVGPQYTYAWSNATGATALSPGGAIPLANANVGQISSVTVTVSNAGTGSGQVSVLGVSGQGLSIANLPALPFTLPPQGSQSFTLNFAPTQPGVISGTLTIGADTFTITATGIGPLLTYTYTNAAATIPVLAGGAVTFQPTPVESTASVTFSVQNTGTGVATISSIALGTGNAVFGIQKLPSLPANLNPGGTITFSASFSPNGLGIQTDALLVNTDSFTLSGAGTQPAPFRPTNSKARAALRQRPSSRPSG